MTIVLQLRCYWLVFGCLTIFVFCSTANSASDIALETITVTADRSEQPVSEVYSSLSVVSQKDIELVSPVHISELLDRVPGVWVSRGNGQESLISIRSPVLTGAGSCGAFFVAEEGVSVRPTGFCNVNQLFDVNTEQASRIEVLRGPGTVVHGSDAVHGVINVISQKPSKVPASRIDIEGGANDYRRVKLNTSDSMGQFGYRISFNGATDGGYQIDSGYDQQKLTARVDWQADAWQVFSLLNVSNLNQETAGYVEGYKSYADKALRKTNPNPEAYRDSMAVRWQTHFERVLYDGRLLIVAPYARYSEMEFLMHYLPGQPVEENGQFSWGVQSSIHDSVTAKTSLTYGVDLEFVDAYLKQRQTNTFNWSIPAGKQYDYSVDSYLVGAFVRAEHHWREKFSLSLGGRYEYLNYDYANRMLDGDTDENGFPCLNGVTGDSGCRYTRPGDRSDSFGNYTLDGGLHYHVSDTLMASVRLTHGFRAPQAAELYRLQAGQMEAALESEEIGSLEVGLKGESAALVYDLTTYYMTKENVIFQSSDRLNVNGGQTEHIGFEYNVYWPFSQYWDLTFAGSVERHRYAANVTAPGSSKLIRTEGNDVVSAPRHSNSTALGWWPSLSTRFEVQLEHIGAYYTDLENLHRYDGHWLTNFRMRHQIGLQWNLGLRVNNITDRAYAERADYSSFSGDRYFVGQPRSVFLDVRFDID